MIQTPMKPAGLRSLTIILITAFAVVFTPALASAQQCLDIFKKSVAPEGISSTDITKNGDLIAASRGMSAEAQFQLFLEVFDKVPGMKPFASRQMLRIAEENLKDHKVAYKKVITERGGVLLITPSDSTPLNKFAKTISENYDAILQIDPYMILTSHENGAFTTYTSPNKGEPPSPALNLSWKHISDIDHLRYARDPEFLNELRHLKTFHDLADRKPSPFYGEISILGKIPGDLNSHIAENSRFFHFDKIKIYHSFIKEELTALRGLIHKKAPQDVVETQRKKVMKLIGDLNVLSARTGFALNQYFKPGNTLISGKVDAVDYQIVAEVVYNDANGNTFTIKVPLVHSIGLYNPKNGQNIDRQLTWLWDTARIAVQQSGAASKLFSPFKTGMDDAQAITIIDAIQNVMSVSALVPPEPQ